MKLNHCARGGPSSVWAFLFRLGLARPPLNFWRVVVEVRPAGPIRSWPRRAESGVTAVFVWARTSEEAEGLALLALDQEQLGGITADATRTPPAAWPRRFPMAVARTGLVYLARREVAARVGPDAHR